MSFQPGTDVRREVLSTVLATYEARVYDCAYRDALRPKLESDIDALLSEPDFEHRVDQHLRGIGTHPIELVHDSNRRLELRRLLAATFHRGSGDNSGWTFQDVHSHGAAARHGARSGDAVVSVGGTRADRLSELVVEAAGSTRVEFQNGSGLSTLDVSGGGTQASAPRSGLGYLLFHRDPNSYVQSSILEGGIGYVRVAEFPGLIGVDMANQIDRAFHRVRRCRRLIVDIRGNPGGGTANLRLMTHLTPVRIPVGYSLTRRRTETGYKREDLPQFTRIPRSRYFLPFVVWKYRKLDKSIVVVTEGRKPLPYDGRIALLINEHTTSGAEIVAGFAADHRLATLVGTRTRGRLLGFSRFPVGHGYTLTIPVSNYVTWEGKTFEQTGVAPHVELGFDPKAAKAGRDVQLEAAVSAIP